MGKFNLRCSYPKKNKKMFKIKKPLSLGLVYGLGSFNYCKSEIIKYLNDLAYVTVKGIFPSQLKNYIPVVQPYPHKSYYNIKELHEEMSKWNVDYGCQILPNNTISSYKTAVKWLEWTLANKPTITPEIGEYTELINGVHTLKYRNKDEFLRILNEVSLNGSHNKKLIKNSRELIIDKYTFEKAFNNEYIAWAKNIVYMSYRCNWRVLEPIKWFNKKGKESKWFGSALEASNYINKNSLWILSRKNNESEIIRKVKKIKQPKIIYEIDDSIFIPESECYEKQTANFIKSNIDIIDGFFVSTQRLKTLMEKFINNKKPVFIRQMAIDPDNYKGLTE